MSITDELREYTKHYSVAGSKKDTMLTAIADRIDAEHEQLMAEQFESLTYDMEPMTDERMAEHGWVRLPVDADGECIRVGDKMDGYGKTIEVVELRIGRSGWVIVSRDGNAYADIFAFTHYKPPTVEDVLVAMLERAVGYSDAHTSVALNTIAEYAAKLQLRGEGE